MILYESHMGGFFTSEESLDWEDTYCETCGDYDQELGRFENKYELYQLLAEHFDREAKQFIDAKDWREGYHIYETSDGITVSKVFLEDNELIGDEYYLGTAMTTLQAYEILIKEYVCMEHVNELLEGI